MNLFEKLHNYRFQEQLHEQLKDIAVFPVLEQEKVWLKAMLEEKEAAYFLQQETMEKVEEFLMNTQAIQWSKNIIEQGTVRPVHEWSGQFRHLTQIIRERSGVRLNYRTKRGDEHIGAEGIPYRLEYNMAKHKWYLLWQPLSSHDTRVRRTPLHLIMHVEAFFLPEWDVHMRRIEQNLLLEKQAVTLRAVRPYADERQRLFYAFSCFEKEVNYNQEDDVYEITVYYFKDEAEHILSRIRMFGRQIVVTEPAWMRELLKDTALRALERYAD